MLTSTLRTILERAASDAAFREQLLTKPDEALASYSLSNEEAVALRSLSREQLTQLATDLGALDGELTEEALDKVAGGTNYYLGTVFCNVPLPHTPLLSLNCIASLGANGGITYACH